MGVLEIKPCQLLLSLRTEESIHYQEKNKSEHKATYKLFIFLFPRAGAYCLAQYLLVDNFIYPIDSLIQ